MIVVLCSRVPVIYVVMVILFSRGEKHTVFSVSLSDMVRRRRRLLICTPLSTNCFLILETAARAKARRALGDLTYSNFASLEKLLYAIKTVIAYRPVLFTAIVFNRMKMCEAQLHEFTKTIAA
jgi:hypothetical protein